MKDEDRILDVCLEEVVGRVEPPDLTEKVRQELEAAAPAGLRAIDGGQPRGTTPVAPGRSFRRWPWWAAAAAAGLLLWAGGILGSREDVPQVLLEVRVLQGELTWPGEGEPTHAEAGDQVQIPLREGTQLRSGTVPAILQLTQFGTLYTETNTILEVQAMDIRQRKGAVTIGAVTLVVLAGAVTFNALVWTEEAETGETLRLETADPQPGEMTAREQGRLDEIEELKRRLAEAEARASRTRMEDQEVVEPIAADLVAGGEPRVQPRFVDDKYGAALAKVDWKVVGEALNGMVPTMEDLAAALLAGEESPFEIAGQLQQLNGQLLTQLQPLMEGEVPGSGPNGTFTHPLVVANQVDQTLAAAELPLTEAQSESLSAITSHYLALDENLRVSAEGYELSLETTLQETAMKAQMRNEIEGILSTEQHQMLYPDAVQGYNGLDLFGTGLVWAAYARPMQVDGPQGAATRLLGSFTSGLELGTDQVERLRPLLDNWSRSYPAEYWTDTSDAIERTGMVKTRRTRIAAERQLALFKAILASGALTPEQRVKFVNNNGVFVPLVR